jgi:hypothetical protein
MKFLDWADLRPEEKKEVLAFDEQMAQQLQPGAEQPSPLDGALAAQTRQLTMSR